MRFPQVKKIAKPLFTTIYLKQKKNNFDQLSKQFEQLSQEFISNLFGVIFLKVSMIWVMYVRFASMQVKTSSNAVFKSFSSNSRILAN
mmetsp:Transcript_3889/g.5448  ORF Transcript_3889/g.5448 Transcript_3889/m.5448 type:complete len:88 (-) Transcript_3889:958-1221(-)